MTSTVMDLASGSLGGIAGTIVGHPFDTLKGNQKFELEIAKHNPTLIRFQP